MDYDIEKIRHIISQKEFDEYPTCCLCGSDEAQHLLTASDGNRIVECQTCKLWFTSPRLKEEMWEYYIRNQSNARNRKFTDNRIKHGVALEKNIKRQPRNWRKLKRKSHRKTLRLIKKWQSNPIKRVHEVGCGVGFFIDDLKNMGLKVSGNDLNGYACEEMKKKFDLEVWNDNFANIPLNDNSIDLVIMNDFIEHSYHPFEDVKTAYKLLKPEGILYIQTFIVDSDPYNKIGKEWDMLWWNHVYHFSMQSLVRMLEKGGFKVKMIAPNLKKGLVEIIAKNTKLSQKQETITLAKKLKNKIYTVLGKFD